MTHGWRVRTELPIMPWFPAATTVITPRLRAYSRASSNLCALGADGCARAALTFSTRAPASTVAMIAVMRSSGAALGTAPDGVSAKMGHTRRVQLGQMAGAAAPLLALR